MEISFAIHTVEVESQNAAQGTNPVRQLGDETQSAWLPDPRVSSESASHLTDEAGFGPLNEHDVELERADALEWDESSDLAYTADGIGSLSLDGKGIGYMGPQSGNALLRSLQASSILLRNRENISIPRISPEPLLSEDLIHSTTFRNKCLDYYFQYFSNAYPILHEGYFRAQYAGREPLLDISEMLILMIRGATEA